MTNINSNRILIAGSDYSTSIERLYLHHLSDLGYSAKLVGLQNIFIDFYHSSIFNKILFRSGLSRIYNQINTRLLKEIEAFQPAYVWVFKGMEVQPASLKKIREMGIKLINYNPDNPFIFSGKGSGNKNVSQSIPFYDLHLTYNLSVKEKIQEAYNQKVAVLPFGFELEERIFQNVIDQPEVLKVCFLGNPDEERAQFLMSLAEKGIKIDLYGHYWHKFVNHLNLAIHPPAYGDDFWKVLRRYRVQLNLMRPHNMDSHNMRSFEIPGIGGIMVAPETREHRLYFKKNKNVFLFNSIEECKSDIQFLLGLSFEKAEEIRLSARAHAIESLYTYRDRTILFLEHLKLLQ